MIKNRKISEILVKYPEYRLKQEKKNRKIDQIS